MNKPGGFIHAVDQKDFYSEWWNPFDINRGSGLETYEYFVILNSHRISFNGQIFIGKALAA